MDGHYLCLCLDPHDSLARTRHKLIVPVVRLCEIGDTTQAIVEQDALDAGGLETYVAEVDIIYCVPLVLESIPGGLPVCQAIKARQFCGRPIACQGVAAVVGESVAVGL